MGTKETVNDGVVDGLLKADKSADRNKDKSDEEIDYKNALSMNARCQDHGCFFFNSCTRVISNQLEVLCLV